MFKSTAFAPKCALLAVTTSFSIIFSQPTLAQSPATAGANTAQQGTGFSIWPGLVVTANHVVDGCDAARIVVSQPGRSKPVPAEIIRQSTQLDIVVLRIDEHATTMQSLPIERHVEVGEFVGHYGFPLHQRLPPNFATGSIAATSGNRGDPRLLQVQMPINQGSSGGAIVNANAHANGMVLSRDTQAQSVMYALSGRTLANFLDRVHIPYRAAGLNPARLDPQQVAAIVRAASGLITCSRPDPTRVAKFSVTFRAVERSYIEGDADIDVKMGLGRDECRSACTDHVKCLMAEYLPDSRPTQCGLFSRRKAIKGPSRNTVFELDRNT